MKRHNFSLRTPTTVCQKPSEYEKVLVDFVIYLVTGQRYAFLLKPVKDLAANWSIDIASQLEQYVENLRKELQAREKEDDQGSQQRKKWV